MTSVGRVVRAGAGVGAVVGAAVILSACTQSVSSGPASTTPPTTSPTTLVNTAPVDACASATATTLDAALNANKQIASAIVVDSKGLQNIKCTRSWAVARFSNNIDGGSVVFSYENGAWVAKDAGTDVCDGTVPAAFAPQLCD